MKKYDFCKMMRKAGLQVLRNEFKVDIEKLDVSNNFKGNKYTKDMANDIFLFFNKKGFIGLTIGNKYDKKYDYLNTTFIDEFYCHYNRKTLNRNWKNLNIFATDVIHIKKSDMTLRKKQNNTNKPKSLNERLKEYKINKYDKITHEQILNKSKEVVSFINERLFETLPNEYKYIKWFTINSYPKLLESFSKDVNDYIVSYNRMNKNKGFDEQFDINEYNTNKINILKWYKTLIG